MTILQLVNVTKSVATNIHTQLLTQAPSNTNVSLPLYLDARLNTGDTPSLRPL